MNHSRKSIYWPRILISLFLLIAILTACLPTRQETPQPATATPAPVPTLQLAKMPDLPWWHQGTLYELFVRSYYDSNGDGIGDFKGLTEKLDYLNDGNPETKSDLVVTGLWLMPIFPATSYHGYDVTDYMTVNPDYGTMEDFKAFLAAAHQRGIRVIIDFVINHTSIHHPWFESAVKDPNSPYRDYYIWSQTDPGYVGPWNEQVWYKTARDDYYYAVFWSGMPDLNYRTPAVREEIKKITTFWLNDVGVDGFRLDGARHLIEDGKDQVNTPETHAYLKEFNALVKSINPQALVVGEVWESSFSVVQYIKDQNMDLAFGFDLSTGMIKGLNQADAKRLGNSVSFETNLYPDNSMATFLTNHDMNRVSNQLLGEDGTMKNAAVLLLTSKGVPFVYYGEEIGMFGAKPDEQIRTPMQWSSADRAGFSTGGKAWMGVNSDYKKINVELQSSDAGSLLNLYRALIQLRQKTPALLTGSYRWIDTGTKGVYAAMREFEGQVILILINLTDAAVSDYAFDFDSNQPGGKYATESLLDGAGLAEVTLDENGAVKGYHPVAELPAYAHLIIQLRPAQ